jgi:hypothetical protein
LDYNAKTDPKETGCGGIGWIYLAQDSAQRLATVDMAMKLPSPFLDQLSDRQLLKDSDP